MKAALYIRVSTHYQIDKDSLPFQRSELINYAKYALGITDYEIFEDAGYSGKNTDRPKFQEMMTRIRNKEFTHLLVWKIDRVSRNLLDFCDMYEEIKKYGCVFVSKNEQFDTSSAMGEAMLKIILVFAELERKLTAERVSAIMLSRAEKGLWNGANVPIGYKYDDIKKFPKIDKKESVTVKYIYDMYQKCESTAEVTNLLNSNNIQTKRGGLWTSKTVGDIIRNPFYKGTYRYNYRESARGAKKKEDEWIIIEDNHEGIISKEQWELCNAIMDKNAKRNNAHHRKNSHTHVLAGLLECGSCGRAYLAHSDRPRRDGWKPSTYRCTGRRDFHDCDSSMTGDVKISDFIINYIANYIRVNNKIINNIDDLEKMLLNNTSYKLTKNSLSIIYSSLKDNNQSNIILSNKNNIKKSSNTKLKAEKEKYKRALNRLEDLYLFDDESMSEKDYILKKKKIEDKLKEVDKEIKKSNTTISNEIDLSILSSNAILKNEILNSDYINYKELDMLVDRKLLKEFINTLIEKIKINPKGLVKSITFKNGLTHTFIQD